MEGSDEDPPQRDLLDTPLGVARRRRGQRLYAQAEAEYFAALLRLEWRGDASLLMGALDEVAWFYEEWERPSRALWLMRRALEVSERSLPVGHPDPRSRRMDVARELTRAGQLLDADPLYDGLVGSLAPDVSPVDAAELLIEAASVKEGLNRSKEAEDLYRRAIVLAAQAGRDLDKCMRGRFLLLAKALEERRPALFAGIAHLLPSPTKDLDCNSVTLTFDVWGRALSEWIARGKRGATEVFEQAIEGVRKWGCHPGVRRWTADALRLDLAQFLIERDHGEEAKLAIKEVLDWQEHCLRIADLYHAMGCAEDAERHLDLWLREMFPAIEVGSPRMSEYILEIASALFRHARLDEAEPWLLLALDVDERENGECHLRVARSLENLAVLRAARGRQLDARPLLERAIAIRRQDSEEDKPGLAGALDEYGHVLRLLDQNEAAVSYEEASSRMWAELGSSPENHLDSGRPHLARDDEASVGQRKNGDKRGSVQR